jgi:hypothetical protein
VVKWSEGLRKRCLTLLEDIQIIGSLLLLPYSFGSVLYLCIYGCMFCVLMFNFVNYVFLLLLLLLRMFRSGARGGVVVKALRYKPAGCGFDSRWCHWNFSVA